MKNLFIGDKSTFAIEYSYFDESRETQLAMYVNGTNILAFDINNIPLTTRWNLDELALWLRSFVDNMQEDPFPVTCSGEYAAQKDDNARDFDSEDEDVFDAYYEALYEWDQRHRWHPASSGAILADVYFQLVGDNVEISWNNQDCEPNVVFQNVLGGAAIEKKSFISIVDSFLKDYATHWFN